MSPASTMNAANVQFSSAVSDVRDVTSSHTTASAGEPSASRTARSIRSETWKSTSRTEIEPSRSTPRSRRSLRTTDASSRARSTRMRSPSGRRAAPGRWTRLHAERLVVEQVEHIVGQRARHDDAQVVHGALVAILGRRGRP